jgi:PHD/YefM family antitoxin component YafN of YafNO toxin-antitoxin module
MIELTEEQRRELDEAQPVAIDPRTRQVYVLVPEQTYERIKELVYDDSPWSDEEMDFLAEEAGELLDEYRP